MCTFICARSHFLVNINIYSIYLLNPNHVLIRGRVQVQNSFLLLFIYRQLCIEQLLYRIERENVFVCQGDFPVVSFLVIFRW